MRPPSRVQRASAPPLRSSSGSGADLRRQRTGDRRRRRSDRPSCRPKARPAARRNPGRRPHSSATISPSMIPSGKPRLRRWRRICRSSRGPCAFSARPPRLDPHLHAIAVEFDLMAPALPRRRALDASQSCGGDELGQFCRPCFGLPARRLLRPRFGLPPPLDAVRMSQTALGSARPAPGGMNGFGALPFAGRDLRHRPPRGDRTIFVEMASPRLRAHSRRDA